MAQITDICRLQLEKVAESLPLLVSRDAAIMRMFEGRLPRSQKPSLFDDAALCAEAYIPPDIEKTNWWVRRNEKFGGGFQGSYDDFE